MKHLVALIAAFLTLCHGYAADTASTSGAEGCLRQVVQSLLDGENKIAFHVADKVFAIDTGNVLTKADLQNAWSQLAEKAFKKKVTLDQFFRDVELRIGSPRDNKRLMSNKQVLESYTYRDGDLYCDASHVKEGVDNFVAYNKAFIYIIRKVDGQWTLIGIGG